MLAQGRLTMGMKARTDGPQTDLRLFKPREGSPLPLCCSSGMPGGLELLMAVPGGTEPG